MNENKAHIRQEILMLRKALPFKIFEDYSQKITHHISHLAIFQNAKNIAIYQSNQQEVSLTTLTKKVNQKFYLPKIIDAHQMIFCLDCPPYSKNQYGILEPENSTTYPIEKMDIVLLPLVGFDKQGHRLGMGKGFYDKALANVKNPPLRLGIAYAFQERQSIPIENHDQIMDFIITEKGVWNSKNQCYD